MATKFSTYARGQRDAIPEPKARTQARSGKECVVVIMGPPTLRADQPGMYQKMGVLESSLQTGMADNKIDLDRIHVVRGPFLPLASEPRSEVRLLQHVEERYPGVPIIVMTSRIAEQVTREAMEEAELFRRGKGGLIAPVVTGAEDQPEDPFIVRLPLKYARDAENTSYSFNPEALYPAFTALTERLIGGLYPAVTERRTAEPARTTAPRPRGAPLRRTTEQTVTRRILRWGRSPRVAGNPGAAGEARRRGGSGPSA